MQNCENAGGEKKLWPVMITPLTESGAVDYGALERLILWYQDNGVHGLFALCQSSEMFFLSLEERVKMASFIVERASVPVIASGHISERPEDQEREITLIAETGVSAVILLTNRITREEEPSERWLANLERLLGRLDETIPLGFYECPYPYRRLFSDEELQFCAATGRFVFLKDTCCDLATIRRRIRLLEGSPMAVYNANTPSLLESLRVGAAGFSGVMLNFFPDLFRWLVDHWEDEPEKARSLQEFLTLCSLCEAYGYPLNAKYHLGKMGLPIALTARSLNPSRLVQEHRSIIDQMDRLADTVRSRLFR